MDQEKWLGIKDLLKEKFSIEEESSAELEDRPGTVDTIIFTGPVGRIKLERIRGPRVIDKKTTYSQRIGSEVKVDYIYDDKEIVERLNVYRYNSDLQEWDKISAESLGL